MMATTTTTTTTRTLDVFDWNSLYHRVDEDVPTTEFVGGFFARKHVTILASKAGIGKTWYIIKLLADLSVGGTIFLSQAYYQPPMKCLLFVGETNVSLVIERFKLLRSRVNFDNIVIVSYMEAARSHQFFDLDTKGGAELISQAIKGVNPDIVVFDTLMSFRRDDENSAQSTRDMMSRLQFIADNGNAAILATHHLRKSDKKERHQNIDQDEIIGSSALVRLSSSAFIMTKNYNAVALHCVKSWWKVPPKLAYLMKEIGGQIEFEVADDSDDITEKRLRAERYVQEQFERGGQLTTKSVMDTCKVSYFTAHNALEKFGVVFLRGSSAQETIYSAPPKLLK